MTVFRQKEDPSKTVLILASHTHFTLNFLSCFTTKSKVKSCYNPLRLGTVIVLVSSGIDFVNSPHHLYSDPRRRPFPSNKDYLEYFAWKWCSLFVLLIFLDENLFDG